MVLASSLQIDLYVKDEPVIIDHSDEHGHTSEPDPIVVSALFDPCVLRFALGAESHGARVAVP